MSPSSTTPNPERKGRKAPKDEYRSLEQLQSNDRSAIQSMLKKLTTTGKWKQMTPKDREAAIRQEVSAKFDKGNASTWTRTVKKDYPQQFDEEGEVAWYLGLYRAKIEEPVDGDDEEALPNGDLVGRMSPRVKREHDYHESSDDGTVDEASQESTAIGLEAAVDEEDELEDGYEDEELFTCEVVTRGLIIQTQSVGPGRHPVKVKGNSKPNAATNSRSGKGKVVSGGIGKKCAKPSWKWVDRKMIVWPPVEAL